MRASARPNHVAASITVALVLALALVSTAHATYPRPKSAVPFRVAFVPAFEPCTASNTNREHGPPLDDASCSPPVPTSTSVTIGTPDNNAAGDNSEGSVRVTVQPGVPGPPEDSDILIRGSISDVRCIGDTTACGSANAADGPDYIGGLQGTAAARLTDRWNAVSAGGGTDAATVVDFPFPYQFMCASTADVDIGGLCTTDTSFNAVLGGSLAVRDGKRAVWAFGQAQVNDGGPDGDVVTAPNTLFLAQGLFVP